MSHNYRYYKDDLKPHDYRYYSDDLVSHTFTNATAMVLCLMIADIITVMTQSNFS